MDTCKRYALAHAHEHACTRICIHTNREGGRDREDQRDGHTCTLVHTMHARECVHERKRKERETEREKELWTCARVCARVHIRTRGELKRERVRDRVKRCEGDLDVCLRALTHAHTRKEGETDIDSSLAVLDNDRLSCWGVMLLRILH